VGGDGMMCAWDTRSQQCSAKVLAHPCEVMPLLRMCSPKHSTNVFANAQVLCCDWNKYDAFCVATGAVDRR
jgi:hypothetical protein